MSGGLMQLVAYGAQDVYLTGNPQITFFKVVYRRHTNFSVECIEQTFNGNVNFGKSVNCTISRNGDLISQVFLKVTLPKHKLGNGGKYGYCENLGFALIDNVTCEIGGTTIDKQYGEWMYIWDQLSGDGSNRRGLDNMIGNVSELTELREEHESYTLYVPLYFWFCRNNGLALPLIALQYHEVKIKLQFRSASEVIIHDSDATSINDIELDDASLLVDYIYLDSEERKRFAQASHEYLIEQVQHTGHETISKDSNKIRLNFNHPCKFLVWGVKHNQGRPVQRPVWHSNAENVKEMFGRFIALLKCEHNTDGVTKPHGNNGEANELSWPSTTVFGQLAANVDAIVAQDDGVSSTSNVALMRNDLTSEQISMSMGELQAAYNDAINALNALNLSDDQKKGTKHLFDNSITHVNPFDFSLHVDNTGNPFNDAQLQLNGHDRFSKRDGNYFNYVQPYQHFSNTPSDGINVYSFALNPEEHQPSGSCNMSRIDNATLSFDSSVEGSFYIYAVNYNVLRIMSGMGGLAYSN